jgi:hypothetical protein
MYLGWFDDDVRKPVPQKLREGAERYREKYGADATMALVNPAQACRCEGLVVKPASYVRVHYFWVGRVLGEPGGSEGAAAVPTSGVVEEGAKAHEASEDIQLVHADFGEWLATEEARALEGRVRLVHADPPWEYEFDWGNGAAAHDYSTLSLSDIRSHALDVAYLAAPDAYLALWCTFPKLPEWMGAAAGDDEFKKRWRYKTGGVWGKRGGSGGMGYHFMQDCELVLLYRRGGGASLRRLSSFWVSSPREGHSVKPQSALRALVGISTDPGDLVLDLYAGASASMARACRALGRRYVGCEKSAERHAEALRRLVLDEQAEMELAGVGAARG